MENKKGIKMTKKLLQEELNKFLSDDKVKSLQKYIKNIKEEENSKFNIFKVLKLDNHEIRHSNFLAWLLNPKENHNLGDKFLKRFLEKANIDISNVDTTSMNIKTEVCTNEQRRIDLLLYTNDFVCVIENKYGSDEHGGQCQDYKKFIEKYSKFKDYSNQKYVCLDLELPKVEQLTKALNCYNLITYKEVYYILLDLLKSMNQNDNATQSIKQYATILKEKYTIMDEKTKEQCQNLYAEYGTIFDTMLEYQENLLYIDIHKTMKKFLEKYNSEYADADNEDIKAKKIGYVDNRYKQSGIRFVPKNIYDENKKYSANKTTKYPVFFALEYNKKLSLRIVFVDNKENWHTQKTVQINFAQQENKIIDEIYKESNNLIDELKKLI